MIKKSVMVLSVFMLLASSLLVGFPLSRVNSSQGTVEQSNPNGYVSEWNYTANFSPFIDEIYGVAVDSKNSLIVVGFNSSQSLSNERSWNITKLDSKGNHLWNYTYDNPLGPPSEGDDEPVAVSVDSEDAFVVAGFVKTSSLPSYNWTVVKFNSTNHQLWNISFRISPIGTEKPTDLAIDHENNIVVVGYYNASSKDNDWGWWITKIDGDGAKQWNYSYNPSDGQDYAEGVAIDSDNNIVVAGFDSNMSSMKSQWKVLKLDKNGNLLWEYHESFSPYNDAANDVAVDHDNNIIVVGSDRSKGENNQQWRVMKLDNQGQPIWNCTSDVSPISDGSESAKAVATFHSSNNITVVGYNNVSGSSDYEWRVLVLGYDGSTLWNYSCNPSNFIDSPRDVAIDHNDAIIVAGSDRISLTDSQWRVMKFRSLSSRVHNLDTGLNYATIQEAIDANETLDGHTLLADAGTYYENVVVNKTVSLVGENPQNTIIDGGGVGDVVHINVNGVNVTGFTVQNGSSSGVVCAGINLDHASYCSITGNNITSNHQGIRLSFSGENVLSGNDVNANNYGGIRLSSSSNNNVTRNELADTRESIRLDGFSEYNRISENDIRGQGNGIVLYDYHGNCSYNVISENNLTGSNTGIVSSGFNNTLLANNLAYTSMWLDDSFNTVVSGNTFVDGGLAVRNSSWNTVTDNFVNGKPIIYLEGISDYSVEEEGQIILVNCTGIKVQDLDLSHLGSMVFTIQLWNTRKSTIVRNNIIANGYGISLYLSTENSVSHNRLTSNTFGGILMDSSSDNSVSENEITSNGWTGICLEGSYRNEFYQNDISNNNIGLEIRNSSGNKLFHNNLGNVVQVHDPSGDFPHQYNSSENEWDDGYPSGGNYWIDYTGVDLHSGSDQTETGSDGIGDAPHVIDEDNTDRYPLMAPYSTFDAGIWNETAYDVDVVSNSTVSDFHFNPEEGPLLEFNVTGQEGTAGFCRVAIPKDLFWAEDGQWVVLVGGVQVANYTMASDQSYTYLCFTYDHSTKTVQIQGTGVIPEFPSFLVLPLLFAASLLAVIAYKRKKPT